MDAREEVSMVVAVGLGGLFALVCPMLNLLTCHMTILGHFGASLGTMQGKMMVTSPSDASATKLFQCCLPNATSISRRIPIMIASRVCPRKGEMHGFLVKLGSCDSDEYL